MSIKYKVKQFINPTSTVNGFYYGRATMIDTLDLEAIGEIIQRNCSMKLSDVMAVLTELVEVMTDAIQNSVKVKIDGLGTFKAALHSQMAATLAEFSSSYIDRIKVNFSPEYTVNKDGSRNYKLIDGAKVEQYGEYERGVNDNQRS